MTTTWITIPTAAKLVNRGRSTIYRWIDEGRLRSQQDEAGILRVRGDRVVEVEATVKRGRPTGTAAPGGVR